MIQKLTGRIRIILTLAVLAIFLVGLLTTGMNFANSEMFKILLAVYCVAMIICSFFMMFFRRKQEK